MKKCYRCKNILPKDSFGINRTREDKLQQECKDCRKITMKQYHRTKHGLITKIHYGQRNSSKHRGHPMPNYTKQELKEWLLRNNDFHLLYEKWVQSGYKKELIPSVDRKNDFKPYSFSNIKLMTFGENLKKSSNDIRNGIDRRKTRAVVSLTLDNKEIKRYYSIRQASRELSISSGRITECCQGKRNITKERKWRYIDELY